MLKVFANGFRYFFPDFGGFGQFFRGGFGEFLYGPEMGSKVFGGGFTYKRDPECIQEPVERDLFGSFNAPEQVP